MERTLPQSASPPFTHAQLPPYISSAKARLKRPLLLPSPVPTVPPGRTEFPSQNLVPVDGNAQETFNAYISDLDDALLVIEATRIGRLPRTVRRLTENERTSVIRHGSIFVYEESQAAIRRWNDDRQWTSSRIQGAFLVYRESLKDKIKPQSSPLMKKTLSIRTIRGDRFRLISYYYKNPDNIPPLFKAKECDAFRTISIPRDYYKLPDESIVNYGDILSYRTRSTKTSGTNVFSVSQTLPSPFPSPNMAPLGTLPSYPHNVGNQMQSVSSRFAPYSIPKNLSNFVSAQDDRLSHSSNLTKMELQPKIANSGSLSAALGSTNFSRIHPFVHSSAMNQSGFTSLAENVPGLTQSEQSWISSLPSQSDSQFSQSVKIESPATSIASSLSQMSAELSRHIDRLRTHSHTSPLLTSQQAQPLQSAEYWEANHDSNLWVPDQLEQQHQGMEHGANQSAM
ncbi:Gti1/Pac2 family-domain-containing protein [Paraphysoderma sedebokerense]|nr:Gti1/Pac2 family-domain-containing protein [Paraphysoderma sedebokerense]